MFLLDANLKEAFLFTSLCIFKIDNIGSVLK